MVKIINCKTVRHTFESKYVHMLYLDSSVFLFMLTFLFKIQPVCYNIANGIQPEVYKMTD